MGAENKTEAQSTIHHDDNDFRPWNITGIEQCGKSIPGKDSLSEADEFKVLYEPDNTGDDGLFHRIYNQDAQNDSSDGHHPENEFKPFSVHRASVEINGGNTMPPDGGVDYNSTSLASSAKHSGNSSQGDYNASQSVQGVGDGKEKVSERGSPKHDSHLEPDVQSDGAAKGGKLDSGEPLSQGASHDDGVQSPVKEGGTTVNSAEMELAFQEGFNTGFEQGKKQGYEEGLSGGREQGYQEGLEKGEQAGYDAGLEKGENDGKVLSDAKALEQIAIIEDICGKIENSWQTLVKNQEEQILSLICKIAEKVTFAKVDITEGVVRDSILNALAVMPEPEEITLNISPEDYEYIEMVKDDFFEKFKTLKQVSVVSNPSVMRGGCKIESSKAKVETDIASRLEAVVSSIMSAGV
ncbi:hypothetical protein MTBBW1_1730057 [Desulfamplus magnetovallimortis]|uniref:Flagellar assembly protein FliH n=1 Tax=Desulfamplus magnetovallimortis TaxID=1246637 RepID=A0A1W1HA09_9BACT|nr:FliH/SctL family protein [Desulfamplus magnetovallimortis]SLM29259.1 hypothetical protein MTBBW1_1730057 [Desulfamplus magnetovallimortis]